MNKDGTENIHLRFEEKREYKEMRKLMQEEDKFDLISLI